jgi:hypothetical protein
MRASKRSPRDRVGDRLVNCFPGVLNEHVEDPPVGEGQWGQWIGVLRSHWRPALVIVVMGAAVIAVTFSWSPYSTSSNTVFSFIAGTAATLVVTALYAKRARDDHRALFCLWLTPVVALLLDSSVIARMIEDKLFGWQDFALPCVYVAVGYIVVLLSYLVISTGRIAVSLFRRTESAPARALSYALQSYLALTLSMAVVYSGVETYTHGKAFAGMQPDWPGNSAAMRNLGSRDPVWEEAREAYSKYSLSPLATQIDALYFSVMTSATVGYGDIHPRTLTMHALVTVHVLVSQFILIVLVGIVFARFAQHSGGNE